VFLHDRKAMGNGEFLNVSDIARIGPELLRKILPL
jgi:hypothetical protein